MADDDTTEREDVREWRITVLRQLGYNWGQRQHLADLIEAGEFDLEQVRHLAEKGATLEEAWWVLC